MARWLRPSAHAADRFHVELREGPSFALTLVEHLFLTRL